VRRPEKDGRPLHRPGLLNSPPSSSVPASRVFFLGPIAPKYNVALMTSKELALFEKADDKEGSFRKNQHSKAGDWVSVQRSSSCSP